MDCYRFAASVVFEVTGKDFRHLFTYRNVRESRRIIVQAGGLLVLTRDVLGEPCLPSECDHGDPVIVHADRDMFGVRFQDSVVVKTRRFVAPLPLAVAVHGWRL
jgi:hypothetical protein